MILFVLALAADAASIQPQAREPETDPVICKNEARTNTRFTRKVCMRKSEADARADLERRAAEEMINKPTINPASNGG